MTIKKAWLVFFAALIVALPVRIFQLLFLVDQNTGFYKDGLQSTFVICVALVLGIGAMMFFCRKERRAPPEYTPVHNLPTAIAGAVAGAVMFVQSSMAGFTAVLRWNRDTQVQGQNNVLDSLMGFAGMAAGVLLLVTAWGCFAGRNPFGRHPLPTLLLPLWGCMCLASLFITYTAVVNLAENIYDTFTVIFLVLFLFAQARLLAGMDEGKGHRDVFAFGLPAVLLALVTGLPAWLVRFSGLSDTSSFPFGLHVVNGFLALYIVVFLAAVWRSPVYREAPVPKPRAARSFATPVEQNTFVLPSLRAAERVGAGEDELWELPGDRVTGFIAEPKEKPAAPVDEAAACLKLLNETFHAEEIFTERGPSLFYTEKK